MADRQSPLVEIDAPTQNLGVDGRTRLLIKELPFRLHINIRGDKDNADFLSSVERVSGLAWPVEPNTVSRNGETCVSWLGPDEWLFITATDAPVEHDLLEALLGQHSSVVDLSGGQTVVRLSGAVWRDVLSSACPLDLHPRAFAINQCAQTVFAHTNVLLIRALSDPEADSFGEAGQAAVAVDAVDIVVRRSFADHVVRWIMDASEECGFEVLAS